MRPSLLLLLVVLASCGDSSQTIQKELDHAERSIQHNAKELKIDVFDSPSPTVSAPASGAPAASAPPPSPAPPR